MVKKRDKKVSIEAKAKPAERASPETEAKFPSHLHPIIQCKHSVLTLSRLEFYIGIAYSAVVWVLPVSGVTRSLILLFALAPLVDVVWRSPWSHAWLRVSKIRAAVLLVGIYLIISATMILHDHSSAAVAIKTYVTEHAEGVFRWAYLVAGVAGYYLSAKLISLLKSYAQGRKAENLAARQSLLETGRGWLDYRLESEKSSRQLHFLVARISRAVKFMALILTHQSWFIPAEGKEPPVIRTKAAAAMLTYVFNTYAAKTEPHLEELEANANLFIDSTEGHLKMATKQGDVQVAELHEYFQAQLKDIRDVVNAFSQLPLAFEKARGTSRELNAALTRVLKLWRSQIATLRKIEGHCARMFKLTQAGFERALEKPLKKLASTLVETAEMMAKDVTDEGLKEQVRELRSLARSAGIKDKSS